MKNSQKGFIIPLLIVVAVLVLGGGVYYYSQKSKSNDSVNNTLVTSDNVTSTNTTVVGQTKKYTDPSGLFTLTYPDNWGIEINENTVRQAYALKFFDKTSLKSSPQTINPPAGSGGLANPLKSEATYNNTLYIGLNNTPNALADTQKQLAYLAQIQNSEYTKEDIVVSAQKGFKISYNQGSTKSVQYFIPLTTSTGGLFYITAISLDNSSGWFDAVSSVVQSITIDVTKSNQFSQQEKDINKNSQVKIIVSNLRVFANGYFSEHPDYTGLCQAAVTTVWHRMYNDALGKSGNVKCTDGRTYAVSAQLSGGNYYCVDSTGYAGETSAPHSMDFCTK